VHPFVEQKIILDIIRQVKTFGAATCAVKAIDTIVEQKGGFIGTTLCRDRLWHIQTPQGFKFNLIYQAHQKAKARGIKNASDDAQLILKFSNKVKIIEGSYQNLKITTPSNLYLARALLQNRGK